MTVETPPTPPLAARLRGVQSSPVRDILALTERAGVISFAGGLPAPELFDGPGTRAAFAAALDDAAVGRTLQYSTTEGDPALRAAVAARLTVRGLPTHADELLITSGSQQALTLIATVLLEPGDTVLVEEPSYLAALQAFQLAGATIVPVPCDDDGIDPEAAAALAARHGARLLYTIPTFQNPTGRTLPLERREALVALARERRLLAARGRPLRRAALPRRAAAAARRARRPRALALDAVEDRRARAADRLGPRARAAAPAAHDRQAGRRPALLDGRPGGRGALARARRPRRARRPSCGARYGPRRDALIAGLADALPPGSSHNHPDGGMFVWARLPDGWDAARAARPRARARRRVRPGLPVLRRPARHRGAAALVHDARPGGDRRGPAPPARGLGLTLGGPKASRSRRSARLTVLVDRQREPQRQRAARRAAAVQAGEALGQPGQHAERHLVPAVAPHARRARLGAARRGARRAAPSRSLAGQPDEPAGGRGADRGRHAGAAQQLDAERRDAERVRRGAGAAAGPGAGAPGPRPARAPAQQLLLEHRAEQARAVRAGKAATPNSRRDASSSRARAASASTGQNSAASDEQQLVGRRVHGPSASSVNGVGLHGHESRPPPVGLREP